jgi:hypothetical protein
MTRKERMRRVGILCIHFARNLAFYKAGMKDGVLIKSAPFWRAANFNFFDQAILEWCKLFGDKKGKHYWEKIVTDTSKFETGLFHLLKMDCNELDSYTDELRKCRDKFIAHLDSDMEDYGPFMDAAYKCIEYYYQYIFTHEDEANYFSGFPENLGAFYNKCFDHALNEYTT